MMYYDQNNFPMDQTMNGGDSCVRAGLLAMVLPYYKTKERLYKYEVSPGMFVRHPLEKTSNNPLNFTRDQMMCLLGGIKATGAHDLARRMFWTRLKSFCFAQNTERDVPGSKKSILPHSFWSESVPTPKNFAYKSIHDVVVGGRIVYKAEHKLGDGPDPLMPNHMGAIILAGKMWYLYWILPICYFFHLINIVLHARSSHYEENQQIAECYIYGTREILKILKPHWFYVSQKYWQDRNEIEYHGMLLEFMK